MEDEIEGLIASTITHIKTALDNDKPGEAKVYTEMLVLLRQTLAITRNSMQLYSKPFEKISEKHIPVVKTKTEIDEMKMRSDYLNITDA